MKEELLNNFIEIFENDSATKAYFAPGRVNLIGEHTDYNGGYVFPCALTIGTYAVARMRDDNILQFYSMNFSNSGIITSSLDELVYKDEYGWTNYPKGVIWSLKEYGYNVTRGIDILYFGNIPNGSGLSSSASIEVLTAFILKDMYSFDFTMEKAALMCQYSENKFNGVNCGIMDQFAIAMGRKDMAIFLNTSTLSYEYAPVILEDAKIVIMNTCKTRKLSDSKYNERRSECENALENFKNIVEIATLCDLDISQFEQYKHILNDETILKRAKHAVYENRRTIEAVNALKENRMNDFGKLMISSHNSLRDDYEVTGIELDTLVCEALKQPGVIGARMTGAGFGGCAISIVKNSYITDFMKNVGNAYEQTIGYPCKFYVVEIGDGPRII